MTREIAQFIELSGKVLLGVITDDELTPADLAQVGVTDQSILRVNRQGDIELRRRDGWDLIGGLLGNFEDRLRRHTGLNWA